MTVRRSGVSNKLGISGQGFTLVHLQLNLSCDILLWRFSEKKKLLEKYRHFFTLKIEEQIIQVLSKHLSWNYCGFNGHFYQAKTVDQYRMSIC